MHHDETMHTHEHTHADGSTHTHEHTHPHDHDHPHTHDHGCDEHACAACSGCADPKQELMALMKYMIVLQPYRPIQLNMMAVMTSLTFK